MGHTGEVSIDQAHRGYFCAKDSDSSYLSINPIYMKYSPDTEGFFSGQNGYGYKAIEDFVVAAQKLRKGIVNNPTYFDKSLATISSTSICTSILEAGRRSLDLGVPVKILYDDLTGLPNGFDVSSHKL